MWRRNLRVSKGKLKSHGLLILAGLLALTMAGALSLLPASADGGGGFPTTTYTATFIFFATPTVTSTPIVIQQLEVFPPTNTALSPQAQAPQPSSPNVQSSAPTTSSSSRGLPFWLFPIFIILAAIVLLVILGRILRRR